MYISVDCPETSEFHVECSCNAPTGLNIQSLSCHYDPAIRGFVNHMNQANTVSLTFCRSPSCMLLHLKVEDCYLGEPQEKTESRDFCPIYFLVSYF